MDPRLVYLLGDTCSIGSRIRATEAQHTGGRLFGMGHAGVVGYLIDAGARVYFAGDTELFGAMTDLGEGLDVALLPIWGWGPRLGPGHLDPEQAARALKLLDVPTVPLGIVLLALVLVGLPVWGAIDAARHPAWAWNRTGMRRAGWIGWQAAAAPFGVGFILAVVYFGSARPKLAAIYAAGNVPGVLQGEAV